MLDPDDEQVIREAKEAGAIFVTWDRVTRLAAGGITPYEALDRAEAEGTGSDEAKAEVSRLRKLTPADLTVMVDGANRTYKLFQEHIKLDRRVALVIRNLRVDEDFSWRAVARYCSYIWGAPWGGNEIAGMVICEKAAKLLDEDFLKPPWN